MKTELKNVLLTRPASSNQSLIEQLERSGISVFKLPMMSIALVENGGQLVEIKQQLTGVVQPKLGELLNLDETFDFALYISSAAVAAVTKFCEQYNVVWPKNLPCVGMGTSTINAIESANWAAINLEALSDHKSSWTIEELLNHPFMTGQRKTNNRVILLKGEKGKKLMANKLRRQGFLVEEVAFYQRKPVEYATSDLESILSPIMSNMESSAVVFNSVDLLKKFTQVTQGTAIEAQLASLRCLVPNIQAALIARESGFEKIVVTHGASDDAILPHLLALTG